MTQPTDEPVGYDGFGAPIYGHQMPPLEPGAAWTTLQDIRPYLEEMDSIRRTLARMTHTDLEEIDVPLSDRLIPAKGQE